MLEAARRAAEADLAVLWVAEDGRLAARVVTGLPALAAELRGARVVGHVPELEVSEPERLPEGLASVARRLGAGAALAAPLRLEGSPAAVVLLLRLDRPLAEGAREATLIAVAQAGLVLRAGRLDARVPGSGPALELAADALAAGADEERAAQRLARLGMRAAEAEACLLWQGPGPSGLELSAEAGVVRLDRDALGAEARAAARPASVAELGGRAVVSLPLGQPPLGVLQIVLGERPDEARVRALSAFAARAAQALQAGARAAELRRELERTRELLSVAGEATAELSLQHALDTVVERVPGLVDVEAVGVYLRLDGRLEPAAARGLAGPHVTVAERLLELAIGPLRARGTVAVRDAAREQRLAGVRAALDESGIEAAHAVPLVAGGDVIGLLAVYPSRGHELTPDQSTLLAALAGQIAVAVQNARLHEETSQLGSERERALEAERVAARRLSALYEISRSFAQSLSLDRTLDAVGRNALELLDVDVAAVRVPDERGESLLAQAVHVAAPQLREPMAAVFSAPEPAEPSPARRRLAEGRPVLLDAAAARQLGRSHDLLVPFLERGATAAVVPIATPSEVLATLTLVSLDPRRPITHETLDTAASVAAQAALAVDNARLYQQQKAFTDTMQRSLLPRTRPRIPGIELGAVYESSALVGVGGDLYDYLQLDDGRLAIVLGDVTGHGIDAAADMAMAKFVFRSLARRYPDPGAFLAAANDVIVEEVGAGKFVTMLFLTVDAATGEVACASAGHPAPRLVHPDGAVEGLGVGGLALGIEPGQRYDELRRPLESGATVLLYTDGVVEARRGGELYGVARLDALLARERTLSAERLAEAVLEDCRRHVGGELRDDCAIVAVRRT